VDKGSGDGGAGAAGLGVHVTVHSFMIGQERRMRGRGRQAHDATQGI
jgi:hypothetical protein